VQPNQPQQALAKTSCLPKRHTKQDLQGQTSLNGDVAELLLPTALAARRWRPIHPVIKPDRQRSALRQAVIERRPIRALIFGRGAITHEFKLSRWVNTVNPIRGFVQQSQSVTKKHLIPPETEGMLR
jgi:hypothetical protein